MYSESEEGASALESSGLKSSEGLAKKSSLEKINPAKVQKVLRPTENTGVIKLNFIPEFPRVSNIFREMSEKTAEISDKSKQMSEQFIYLSEIFSQISGKTAKSPPKSRQMSGTLAEMSRKIAELSEKSAEMSDHSLDISGIFWETSGKMSEKSRELSRAFTEMSRKIAEISEKSTESTLESLPLVEKRKDNIEGIIKSEDDGYTGVLIVLEYLAFAGIAGLIFSYYMCRKDLCR